MTTGFYNTHLFQDKEYKKKYLRKFILRALVLSYDVKCQSIKDTWQRKQDKTVSVSEIIKGAMKDKNMMLTVVDRFASRQEAIPKDFSDYEIVLSYDSIFLWILVNEKGFNQLIQEYGLKLKEI